MKVVHRHSLWPAIESNAREIPKRGDLMEDVVADADLLRIQELPADEYGGASGDKRKFQLEFLGKAPSQRFPYTVANEVVSSHIGNVLGFNIPVVLPCRVGGEPLAMVLWMKPAARRQEGPPLTSRALKEFVENHDDEIHGAIILDLYLGNTDRSFGPERRNYLLTQIRSTSELFPGLLEGGQS